MKKKFTEAQTVAGGERDADRGDHPENVDLGEPRLIARTRNMYRPESDPYFVS